MIREHYKRLANLVKPWIDNSCLKYSIAYVDRDQGYKDCVQFCMNLRITPLKKEWGEGACAAWLCVRTERNG
jgi:hypothetical protein